jgi:uncharacterized protein
LSKALKLEPSPIPIENPGRQGTVALLLVAAEYGVVIAWHVAVRPALGFNAGLPLVYDARSVVQFGVFYGMVLVPFFIALKATRQSWASVGVSRRAVGRMLVLGLVPSAIYLIVAGLLAPSLGGGFAGLTASLGLGFVLISLNAFTEELVWRGYVQSRFEAARDSRVGFALPALLFTLWHFPSRYVLSSGNILEALASTLLVLAAALLFGYFFLRSRNVVPSSVFHLFSNWAIVLWQLPGP